VKQQYTGPYTFDLAARTITLVGIEIPPDRLAVVINATVGFVYHNIEHEPNGDVSIVDGNTVLVFPPYKDCETHRDTDALSIFYDDGVDLGVLIQEEFDETQTLLQSEFDETQTALAEFRAEVKAESDETQTLLQNEFDETQTALAEFRAEVKAESDETQTLLQSEFGETQTALAEFRAEVKAESDETQTLLQTEFDETQTALADFRAEVKAESDETQTLLQTEFDETQTALADFRAEVKAESDETQTLLQAEFDQTQTALTDFRTEVKAESDETQTLIDAKIPALVDDRLPVETVEKFSFLAGTTTEIVEGDYGPRQIVFYRGSTAIQSLILEYDEFGNLVLITPQFWTPALLDTRAIWLDASDTTSLVTSGDYVTRWNSQLDSDWSARPFDPTTASDSRPRTGVSTINGLNVVTFDAVDDDVLTYKVGQRRALADVDMGIAYPAESAFIVARRNAASKSRWVSPGANGNRTFQLFVNATGANRMIVDVGDNRVHHFWPDNFPALGLWGYSFNSDAPVSNLYLNGELKMSNSTPFTALAGRQDGFGGATTSDGSGDDIGEILVLREAVDEFTRQRIEGYLAHKWGLAGELPESHPYKDAPPGVQA
jgi:hypothetical protein